MVVSPAGIAVIASKDRSRANTLSSRDGTGGRTCALTGFGAIAESATTTIVVTAEQMPRFGDRRGKRNSGGSLRPEGTSRYRHSQLSPGAGGCLLLLPPPPDPYARRPAKRCILVVEVVLIVIREVRHLE